MAVMTANAMAIKGRGRPTHLVNHNKRIRIWHRRLAHASNARVIRASNLTDRIDLNDTSSKEYNLAKVFIDSDDSDASDSDSLQSNKEAPTAPVPTSIVATCQANDPDSLDKLCTPCVGSKSTRVVRQNKSATITTNKLEKVHANLWGLHNPPSRSGSTYTAILMCEHIRKT